MFKLLLITIKVFSAMNQYSFCHCLKYVMLVNNSDFQ